MCLSIDVCIGSVSLQKNIECETVNMNMLQYVQLHGAVIIKTRIPACSAL